MKASVDERGPEIDELVLSLVGKMVRGTSQGAGGLASDILQQLEIVVADERDALTLLRSRFRALREERKIRLFQKGEVVPLAKWPDGAFSIGR